MELELRYADTKERSAEYLRIALAEMRKHNAAMHPITYAVWYEYAEGENAQLRRAIDAHVAAGETLDETATRQLYDEHVAGFDEEAATRMTGALTRLLSEIAEDAGRTGTDAGEYGQKLEQLAQTVKQEASTPQMDSRLEAILRETQTMQRSLAALEQRLDGSQQEIAALRRELTEVREEATTDGLTGLRNRRAFDRELAAAIQAAGEGGVELSLMMVDIDHFKRINDTYGHLFGDRVLGSVAMVLRRVVKGRDLVARYGGEEFALLLPNTNLAGAQTVAEQVRSAVANSRIIRQGDVHPVGKITVSAGVTAFRIGESAGDFLHRADAALYDAKHRGRDCVSAR